MEGLLLFYKPIDWRNKDILKFFQNVFGKNIKVGHAGTLDPFAEGLMLMGLGRKFTRQLHDLLLHSKKEYIAEIEFGKISDTYDIAGEIKEIKSEIKPTVAEIKKIIEEKFLGEQVQIPPIYSAKKHHGRRLRDLMQINADNTQMNADEIKKIVESKSKKVTLYDFEIISYKYPYLEIKLSVSSGFYIRSLGNSLGEKLNTGAYLTKLKRTKLKDFSVENALKPEDFNSSTSSGQMELHGKIYGQVQGVGFRYFIKTIAENFAISGYSKNTDHDSMEFLAQGNLSALNEFQKQILKGPEPAQISDYKFIIQKPKQVFKDFKIIM